MCLGFQPAKVRSVTLEVSDTSVGLSFLTVMKMGTGSFTEYLF